MYEVKVIHSITGEVAHLETVATREEVMDIKLEWGAMYELEYHAIEPDVDTFSEAMQQYEDDFGPKS